MTNSTRKPSIIAGVSLLIMTLAAIYTFGFAHSTVVVEDAVQTLKNIQTSSLFKTELLGWLIIIITDIIVTWAIYVVLRPINQKLAALSSILRGIYTAFLVGAVYHLFSIAIHLNAITPPQAASRLSSFDTIWTLGLIFFGLHLLAVGLTVYQDKKRLLGILLEVAGVSYVLVHFLKFFFPLLEATSTIETLLILPMTVGELGLGLWLVVWSGKVSRPASSAPDSAVS